MADEELAQYNTISRIAGADLSAAANLHKFVKQGTNPREVVLCGAGENAIGVLKTLGKAGESVAVQIAGRCPVQADAALATVGTKVMSSADGQAAAATATNHVLGMTDEVASAAGHEISIILAPPPHGILAA